jgi:hypothetical protein
MLLWVYIHTGQAWKICLTTVGIEPTTFGILVECGYTLRVTSQASYSPEYVHYTNTEKSWLNLDVYAVEYVRHKHLT